MKHSRYLLFLPCLLLQSVLLASCDNDDYMTYDTARDGVYFTRDTLRFAFGVIPVEQRTYNYQFQLQVLGTVADEDREFLYEVVADSTTAVAGEQYIPGRGIVPAGSTQATIDVTLLRDGLGGTYPDYDEYTLALRIVEGNGFKPVLSGSDQYRILTFSNAVEMPDWKNGSGEKIWSVTRFGVWHPLKFIKMVEYFHTIADIQPNSYKKMVEAYGENLEHVPFGDFNMFRTMMNKYVFHPMYLWFSDPANHAAILSLYPDFPFDFPDPYESSI